MTHGLNGKLSCPATLARLETCGSPTEADIYAGRLSLQLDMLLRSMKSVAALLIRPQVLHAELHFGVCNSCTTN